VEEIILMRTSINCYRIVLALVLVLYGSAQALAKSQIQAADRLNYLVDGIKHYRTTLPDLSVEILYRSNTLLNPPSIQPEAKVFYDEPDQSSSDIYWIAQDGNLSIDVKLLANLDADPGDNTWDLVGKRLVSFNGSVSTVAEYRKRTRLVGSPAVVRYASAGNLDVQNSLNDGNWDEYPDFDPRSFMYEINGEPIDEYLKDPRFTTKYLRNEEIDNSDNSVIESVYKAVSGQTFTSDFWVDNDHDFIVRKVKTWINQSSQSPNARTLFSEISVSNLHQFGTTWVPGQFEQHTYVAAKTESGKTGVVDIYTLATIKQIPPNDDHLTSPFSIKWIKGTNVYDEMLNKRFVALENGNLEEETKYFDPGPYGNVPQE